MPVILIGTLDTKCEEVEFVRARLQEAGLSVVVVDAGVMGEPSGSADITSTQVYEAAGTTLDAVRQAGDRGKAIEAGVAGVVAIVSELHAQNRVEGVFGLGGSAGTTLGTAAMRALPFGIPKLMVSTLASGQVRPFVGIRDILMMHSVVDISGLNRISRLVLGNAASAMIGMVRDSPKRASGEHQEKCITATMFGVTTPCVESARSSLEEQGHEVIVFHATGTGGQTMEALVAEGQVGGVLDLTTTELADEHVGGILSAGPDRLTAAALHGVPQVISMGALDMVNFGPRDSVPEKFADRRFYEHNANVTLMRTTPEENDAIGKTLAYKASAAKGPTAVLIPKRGVSAIDKEGQPFWWPEADAALFQSVKNWISPNVRLVEVDAHINDPEFAETAVRVLLELMG